MPEVRKAFLAKEGYQQGLISKVESFFALYLFTFKKYKKHFFTFINICDIIRTKIGVGRFKMESRIRAMKEKDRGAVIEMMRVFYASPAVLSNGSEEIFKADFDNCVSDSPYLEGYVFEKDNEIIGYGMLAKSFSTEFGKPCIWVEDIYVKEDFRGEGIGSRFFDLVNEKYPEAIIRLEVEEENERAIRVYRKNGFKILPYMEMKK